MTGVQTCALPICGAQVYAALSVAMVPNPSVPPFYFDPLYNSNGEKVDSVLQRFYSYEIGRASCRERV